MNYKFQVLRNTMFSTAGMYVEYGIGLLTSIIIARTLGPDHYGSYTLIIWFAQLGIVLASGAINQGTVKFVAEKRGRDDPLSVIAVVRYFRLVMTMIVIAISLLSAFGIVYFGDLLLQEYSRYWLFIPWLGMFVRTYYMFYLSVAKGFEDFSVTAIVPAIVSPIYLVLVIIAGLLYAGPNVFLGLFTVTGLLFLLVISRLVGPRLQGDDVPQLDTDTKARMRHHIKVVSTTIILGFLAKSNMEIFFLASFAERSDVGFFRVAHRLAGGLALLSAGIFTAVLLPVMAKTLGEGGGAMKRRFLATNRFVLLLAAPLAAFCIAQTNTIIPLLYGEDYRPASVVFAVLIFSECFGTWAASSNTYLVTVDKQSTIMKLVGFSTALKLFLSYVLISQFQLLGAMISYFVVAVCFAALIIWNAVRHQGVKLEFGRYLRIILASLTATAASLVVIRWVPGLIGLTLAATAFALIYALVVLAYRCLTADDVKFILALRKRLFGSRLVIVDRVLVRLSGHSSGVQ